MCLIGHGLGASFPTCSEKVPKNSQPVKDGCDIGSARDVVVGWPVESTKAGVLGFLNPANPQASPVFRMKVRLRMIYFSNTGYILELHR